MTDDQRKIVTIIVIAVIGFIGIIINQMFWASLDEKRMAYKNTAAGLKELEHRTIELEIEKEAERRKSRRLEARNFPVPDRAASQSASSAGCRTLGPNPNFFTPVELSQGECIAGQADFAWVRFKASPKEISGIQVLAVGVDVPSDTGEKLVRLGARCESDFRECIRNWSGETLFIKRIPGETLILRS